MNLILGLLILTAAANNSPTVRVFNATTGSSTRLDILLDGGVVATGVRQGAVSGPYQSSTPEKASLVICKQGSREALLTIPLNLKYQDHVVAVTGNPDQVLSYGDIGMDHLPPPNEQPQVGILNLVGSDALGSDVDLYVAPSDADLSMKMPDAKALPAMAPTVVTVAPGSYKVTLTVSGAKDVIVSSDSFQAVVKERQVALILPGVGAVKAKVQFLNIGPGIR